MTKKGSTILDIDSCISIIIDQKIPWLPAVIYLYEYSITDIRRDARYCIVKSRGKTNRQQCNNKGENL